MFKLEDDTVQEWDDTCSSGALVYNPQTKVVSHRLVAFPLHLDHTNQVTYDRMMHLCKSPTEHLRLSKSQTTHNATRQGQVRPDNTDTNTKWNPVNNPVNNPINNPKWNPINNPK